MPLFFMNPHFLIINNIQSLIDTVFFDYPNKDTHKHHENHPATIVTNDTQHTTHSMTSHEHHTTPEMTHTWKPTII